MPTIREKLLDKAQTGQRMKELCERFYNDLSQIFLECNGQHIPFSDLPLKEYFDVVRKIPYKMDTRPVEVVARPYRIMANKSKGADCKKKAILMGAYCRYHGIPYRFVASSRRPDKQVHHVFPQGKINGRFINLDATYPDYKLGQKKEVTYYEFL